MDDEGNPFHKSQNESTALGACEVMSPEVLPNLATGSDGRDDYLQKIYQQTPHIIAIQTKFKPGRFFFFSKQIEPPSNLCIGSNSNILQCVPCMPRVSQQWLLTLKSLIPAGIISRT